MSWQRKVGIGMCVWVGKTFTRAKRNVKGRKRGREKLWRLEPSERTIYSQGKILRYVIINQLITRKKWFLYRTNSQTNAFTRDLCLSHAHSPKRFITQICDLGRWELWAHRHLPDHRSPSLLRGRWWTLDFGGMLMQLVRSDSPDDYCVSSPTWAFDYRPDQDV